MIRLTNRNYLVSKIMISINMASKYINEKLSLRKRNGGHMWVKLSGEEGVRELEKH